MAKAKRQSKVFHAPVIPATAAGYVAPVPIRLDLGCGPNKRPGFIGVDAAKFPGVDFVHDLRQAWPWADDSVDEVLASHIIEHFTAPERCHFVNELCRVLKPGCSAAIVVPSWSSSRAYGDPTHQWPPVSEFWFYYLNRDWRKVNAPHSETPHMLGGFDPKLHMECTWGYNMHPDLVNRSQEYQQNALAWYKEAALDIIANLKKPANAPPINP